MKQHVLFKTMPFHALFFFFLKKKDAQNNVVLYGTVHLLLLPLKRIDKGRRRFYPL
jgi:hypothetical protein